jgi:hypothetical protein
MILTWKTGKLGKKPLSATLISTDPTLTDPGDPGYQFSISLYDLSWDVKCGTLNERRLPLRVVNLIFINKFFATDSGQYNY